MYIREVYFDKNAFLCDEFKLYPYTEHITLTMIMMELKNIFDTAPLRE